MIKTPDQQLYDAVFQAAKVNLNYSVYDFLPRTGTAYPFIVLGECQLVPRATKTRLMGRLFITIDLWGDSSSRLQLSNMIDRLLMEMSLFSQIEDGFAFHMDFDATTSRILADNSTADDLWHGIINAEFTFG